MDVADDAEGPLDPRIQIELENLNTATDAINKLEIELDEANTAFGQLLSESSRRSKDIANKLGSSCIERARCYYKALEVARQAQVQCQYQAQLFQRASEIHAAAKETVALAEARFMSHQHEWNFDQAWQDMLNHATIKVMDAENKKAECAREHHRSATLFHDAETKVQQLEEKYRRSILKAEPYFEIRAQYAQMLATQKERVECLQKEVKDAKSAYSSSFRALEEISNQIHQQRRDYDMVVNGPREPGVGAELASPEGSLSYDAELNKVSISRLSSLASSGEPDTDDRAKDFDDVRDLKQRVDQLGGRSADGSESFSSQWELELQASMEKLNNVSLNNGSWEKIGKEFLTKEPNDSTTNLCNGNDHRSEEIDRNNLENGLQTNAKCVKNVENEQKKLPMDFQILKRLTQNSNSTSDSNGWQSLTHSPINSILNRSKIAIRNSLSKSLSNSPVNMSFSFGKSKNEEGGKRVTHDEAKKTSEETIINNSDNRISSDKTVKEDAEAIVDDSRVNQTSLRLNEDNNPEESLQSDKPNEFKMPKQLNPKSTIDSTLRKVSCDKTKVQKAKELTIFTSHSVDSTPVKTKNRLSRNNNTAKSLDRSSINNDFVTSPKFTRTACKTSSVKELPLLSLFNERSSNSLMSKDKSCSMIDLDDRHNLKSLLDTSNLGNIHAVSVERLANARHNIMGQHSDAKTNSNMNNL